MCAGRLISTKLTLGPREWSTVICLHVYDYKKHARMKLPDAISTESFAVSRRNIYNPFATYTEAAEDVRSRGGRLQKAAA